MSVHLLARRRPARTPARPAHDRPGGATSTGLGTQVPVVHRFGAVAVAAVIAVFGVLGLADGLAYFSTSGERIAGLSSNGLLSTISLVTAAVLVGAAVAGARVASTVMIVVGVLFLVSALAGLAVLNTGLNVLAFRLPNVFFSIAAGLFLLLLGGYGRLSGNLPEDSPYARPRDEVPGPGDDQPSTPEEYAAERAIRRAERAVCQHTATADQRRRVEAMSRVSSPADRRRVWLELDRTA
jgi:Domain of unknown function (DUF4383)